MKLKSKLLLALLAVSGVAFADEAAAPEDSLTYNVGAVSQYRYRGISQTKGTPALQGGADFAAASGWYVGTWASTISWIADEGNAHTPNKLSINGPVELDLYGGYKFDLNGIGMDVGYLKYQYLGNQLAQVPGSVNANTDEVYAAATYGIFTLKDSYSLSNLFGNANSKGSQYLDLSATVDLGEGYSLVPHVGRQVVANNAIDNYTDYSLTVNKDLGRGLSASLAAVGTNAQRSAYTLNDANYYEGRKALVIGVKYAF
jgi:uncharacterized protein (TIGR02001 family)